MTPFPSFFTSLLSLFPPSILSIFLLASFPLLSPSLCPSRFLVFLFSTFSLTFLSFSDFLSFLVFSLPFHSDFFVVSLFFSFEFYLLYLYIRFRNDSCIFMANKYSDKVTKSCVNPMFRCGNKPDCYQSYINE